MNFRSIKFILCEESRILIEKHTNAFLLLSLIAERARLHSGNPDGLEIGEAYIGDYKKAGITTRNKYRTALNVLVRLGHIEIIETCRSQEKIKKRDATLGTLVKLISSTVFDISAEMS